MEIYFDLASLADGLKPHTLQYQRLRSACAHDTYHWPKQLLPWIQMSRFSGMGNSKEICLSMRKIGQRGCVEIACARGNLKT